MAEGYNTIWRQVAHRANLLVADDPTTLGTNYTNTAIGATQMGDRAIEWPKIAVDDAILNAGDRLVALIGADKNSPYRPWFADVSASVASGSTIPLISNSSKSRVGVFGDVRDASTSEKLVAKDYKDVIGFSSMTNTLKQTPFWYYTDNVRIWHTRTNVTLDFVIWDKADQMTLLAATPRGNCPFPQELHEALVCGALTFLFKEDFNQGQMPQWRQTWADTLARMSQPNNVNVEQRKLEE